MKKIIKTDDEWRSSLTEDQYHITREKGTEVPFSGAYWDNHEEGVYKCCNCGLELFSSDTKFDSGTGWPSFDRVMDSENVETKEDVSHGMKRVEVICARCGAHLGHLFPDGPTPTGARYCINSAALDFAKKDQIV